MTEIRNEPPERDPPMDHGILFSAPMVLALLDGRKTATRRLARPRWRPGDRLWVRESFRLLDVWDDQPPIAATPGPWVYFEASGGGAGHLGVSRKARPSIHMPRWASRLTLTVRTVGSERLQAITKDEARAEGLTWVPPTYGIPGIAATWNADPRLAYAALWDSLHPKPNRRTQAPPPTRWADNPIVWATTFSVSRANIGPPPTPGIEDR